MFTGGTTTDACGCCTVCAKVEGEKCGGPWNIAGVCDKGLICVPQSDFYPGQCFRGTLIFTLKIIDKL